MARTERTNWVCVDCHVLKDATDISQNVQTSKNIIEYMNATCEDIETKLDEVATLLIQVSQKLDNA